MRFIGPKVTGAGEPVNPGRKSRGFPGGSIGMKVFGKSD
jgi:hypothetical protein